MTEKPPLFEKMKSKLRGKRRTGKPKLLYISEGMDDVIKEYAEKLHKSQSSVAQELMLIGHDAFRKKHNLDLLEKKSEQAQAVESKSEDKGKEIAEAYGKRILHSGWRDGRTTETEYNWSEQE